MMISWDNPQRLILMLAALVPLGLAWSAQRRGRPVSISIVVLQAVAIVMLVVGLAAPRAGRSGEAVEWLVFDDLSASMPELPELELGGHASRRVWFNQELHSSRPFASLQSRTCLAGVLDFAAADMDQVAGVILRTDGRWHDDVADAAGRLRRVLDASGKPMIVLPHTAPRADAAITAFSAKRTRAGQITLTATLEANHICSRRLRIRAVGGLDVFDREYKLLPRQSERITLMVPATASSRFVAELTPDDALANNRREASAPNTARTLAILVHDGKAWVNMLAKHLPGWEILTEPSEEDVLSASVILADKGSLHTAVNCPGGVVLLDGVDSPLSPLLPDSRSRTPLAVTVLLDASASMGAALPGGHTSFELACEATRNLAAHLSKDDSVRVILFHSAAKQVFAGRGDQLATFRPETEPAGQTDVAPALQLAAAPVAAGKTPLVLVFSDLDTTKFDVSALAKTCRAAKLKLAVAAVGEASADAPLASLCKQLGASLSILKSPRELNALFASVVTSARPPIRVAALAIRAEGHAAALTKLAQPISLRLCRPRDGATVLATAGGEPLCAVGTYQGRKTAAIALVTPSAQTLAPAAEAVAALVTLCASEQADPRLALSLRRIGREISLTVTARDKDMPMTKLALRAQIAEQTAELSQTAPGRYEAKLTLLASLATAPQHVAIRDTIGRVVASGVAQAQPPQEAQTLYPAPGRLRQLAADLGATVATEEELPALMTQINSSRGSLASVCYLLALAAMLAAWTLPIFTKPAAEK